MKMQISSNSKDFLREVERDMQAWKAGAAEGVAGLAQRSMGIARESGFAQAPGPSIITRNGRRQYPEGGSMNLANSKGQSVFSAGRIVDRGGRLQDDLAHIDVRTDLAGGTAHGSNARGSRIDVRRVGDGAIVATMSLPEDSSMMWAVFDKGLGAGASSRIDIDGNPTPDQQKNQRRIIRRAYALVLKAWKQSMKGSLDKWMRRNFK